MLRIIPFIFYKCVVWHDSILSPRNQRNRNMNASRTLGDRGRTTWSNDHRSETGGDDTHIWLSDDLCQSNPLRPLQYIGG